MAPKRKRNNYSQENMLNAIAEVKRGSTLRKSAEKYGVPVMTLSDKIRGKTPITKHRPGPATYLSEHQESQLIKYLLHMARIGYGIARKDIPDVVKTILDKAEANGYILPSGQKFIDNKPSVCWVYRFLNRHPHVSARTPENLGFQRAYVSENQIRKWFKSLESYLREEFALTASEFLSETNSDRVFNLDESGFPLQGTNGKMKIITERGLKTVHKLAPDTKQQITVLACVSASGKYHKPFVIYPGLNTPKYNFNGVNEEDYDLGFSPNG